MINRLYFFGSTSSTSIYLVKSDYIFYLLLALISLVVLLTSSCGINRHVPAYETLHTSTSIEVDTDVKIKDKAEIKRTLYNLSRPKPNKRLLGTFRMRLRIHNRYKNRQKGFGAWLNERVGEEAVVIDTSLLNRSAVAMEKSLFNNGYFNSTVDYEVKRHRRKRKGNVIYTAHIAKPYFVNNITYNLTDASAIAKLVTDLKGDVNGYLKVGKKFSVNDLGKEIDRITQRVRDRGYFDFSKQYIYYELDSTKSNHTIDVFLNIDEPSESSTHQVYTIENIYIHSEFNSGISEEDFITVPSQIHENCYFIHPQNSRYKLEKLTKNLLLKSGKTYSKNINDHSVNHLLELGVFKFVSIKYEKTKKGYLDCHIYLTPNKKMHLSAEFELNNRSQSAIAPSLLGTAINLSYNNRNLLKAAEAFKFNIYSGLEVNPQPTSDFPLINTLDLSAELSYTVPRFLVPFSAKKPWMKRFISNYYVPKTTLKLSADYRHRFNFFTVNTYSLSFGYNWRQDQYQRHFFSPLSISILSLLSVESGLLERFETYPLLKRSFNEQFEEQIIVGNKYTYVYTNQNYTRPESFMYFRGNIEFAGNFINGFESLLKLSNAIENNQRLIILGNTYSQFIRLDADWRYYHYFPYNKKRFFVTRFAMGMGYAFGNSDVLPYIKQFYVGGTNSVRAFSIRSIGPGSFGSEVADSSDLLTGFDRTGDIKIEANIEYRFDISGVFKGALFADAGNIWTLRERISGIDNSGNYIIEQPGGLFKLQNVVQQLGLGLGAGLRLDFSYFVMRFDLAMPVRDPNLPLNNRWIPLREWSTKKACLNLAIGYPF